MSGSGENAAAADDDTGVANPENNENNEDNDVPNISDADTEPAMLEEEEMPTYMSLTSSSRPDESRVELEVPANHDDDPPTTKGKDTRAPSPCASDDQGGGSIYVVSSGEESYQAYNDEDYESDEMELEDEEEEEDEDDSRRAYNDDEEDSDGDIEPEQFERSSDDFVLRYDTNLEKHHKTRSRSLQDLTTSRGNLSRFVGKRRSVDMMGHYDSQLASRERENLRDPLGDVKKSSKSSRYADVPSKVKLYIQSIKEQNRKSSEHKNRQNPLHKNFNDARTVIPEVSCTRINPANRMIKGYAQNVINAIMEQNNAEKPEVTYGGFRLGENAPEKDPIAVPEAKKIVEKNAEIEQVPDNSTNAPTNLVKNSKSNGIIDFSTQNNSEKMVEPMETCASNGQEQVAAILNLRSVTYEEYANGDEASNKNEIDEITRLEEEAKNGLTELMEQEEILSVKITETRRLPAQKIEIVKVANPANEESRTVRETSEIAKSSSDETPNRENPDVAMLWTMLNEKSAKYNEKSAQYDGIREAFQKTLTENISLKRELEELKKTLAQCKTENKPRETKAVSVQTENVLVTEETKIFNDSKISTNDSKPPMPKLLSSSIGSALSSIEQWSDSNCSPAISINPPNMDHVLNSDDSLLIPDSRTPRRQPRQMSKSFITSSRILQTLANITQGRTRTASPLASAARNVESRLLETEKGQSMRESNISIVGNETKARKRKASDMLGFSNNPETFKIPRTPEISRKKINSDSDADAAPLKSPWVQSRTESTPGGSKDDDNTDRIPDDLDDTEATDVPDNVKCFVYQEEADCKERSFLIQAEEPTKSNDGGEKGGGAVRECGPYLLGNCEIRMSEANGTINIWGKEISQESEYVDVEEEMEEETDPLVENPSQSRRGSLDGQKTPRARFVNGSHNFVCSTNKKSKTSPSIVKSSIGKYFRPALSNLARANSMANEGETVCNDNSPNNQTTGCETCDLQKKRCYHCPNCDHLSNSRRKHSCCRQDAEFNEKECDCARTSRGALDDDVIFELLTNILANHKKCNAAFNKHSCANHANDETCKHQTSRIRPSPDGDCHHAKKRCSSCADDYLPSCNTRLTPRNSNCCDRRSRSHSLASSCDDEEHPLLNGHYETPETKRRRLSGKKVRGILTDLLRGCGGCRDPSNASFVAKETSSLPNIIPTVRVTPCTPTQPSCSKSSTNCAASHPKHPIPRDAGNENCSSCSRRVEMAAEIESKLELLTVEMERLRSRSDTFRGMLNLLNADTD